MIYVIWVSLWKNGELDDLLSFYVHCSFYAPFSTGAVFKDMQMIKIFLMVGGAFHLVFSIGLITALFC